MIGMKITGWQFIVNFMKIITSLILMLLYLFYLLDPMVDQAIIS